MKLKETANKIINVFKREKIKTKTALTYKNDIQILVAVILSAQCTDVRVNKVTKELFKKYKNVNDFAEADINVFKEEIKSTGFFNNKAKNIIASAKIIRCKYKGKVPDNMNELLTLPGVARKTANVVLSSLFDKSEGIVVDTHVKRLSYRIGLTNNTSPEKIEKDLMNILDRNDWNTFPYYLIHHGRTLCSARKPLCNQCFLSEICIKKGVKNKSLDTKSIHK